MFDLASIVERHADRSPDAEAVADGEERLTFAALNDRVNAVAAGLREAGVERGGVVGLLMQNCLEFLESCLAVNRLGGIFLPLNFRLARAEWEYILGHAGASHLIVGEEYVEQATLLLRSTPGLRVAIALGEAGDGVESYGEMRAGQSGASLPSVDVGAEDVQRLMYTSGTTSRPKGVPITHGNFLWKVFAHIVEFGLTSRDRTLMAGPLYHVGAFDLPGVGTLYVGGSLVILPRFEPVGVVRAVQEEKPTNLWLAPSMVNAILQSEEAAPYDTSSVRFVVNGGEKMPVTLVQRLQDRFPNAWLADAYGLTETVSGDTFLPRDRTFEKLGSVGKPVVHLDLRIRDDRGEDVPAGVAGEIVLRGPKVVSSYWRDPEASARAFVDGWFHTGDVGHLDEDGFLYIDDRRKDMIISGGENIASPEIERVLYEHPAVVEAAVVAAADDRWGEVPRAVVVLAPGSDVTAEDLIAHCQQRLAKFKVPRYVDFVDELPRTASGKVLKRELRAPGPPA